MADSQWEGQHRREEGAMSTCDFFRGSVVKTVAAPAVVQIDRRRGDDRQGAEMSNPQRVNPGQWTKGQSGNPKGRPPQRRSLAAILQQAAEYDTFGALENRELLAQHIWEGMASGTVHLAGGKIYELTQREWLDLVKWVHTHLDGTLATHTAQRLPAVEQKVIEVITREPIDELMRERKRIAELSGREFNPGERIDEDTLVVEYSR